MKNDLARRKKTAEELSMENEPKPVNGRVPPHDLDAEAAVLSAVLLERDALDRVLAILKPEHFYSDANRWIMKAAIALVDEGTPVDIQTIASWLRSREQINHIGGPKYLAQLVDATPAVAHVGAHAEVVHEKWRLRQLIGTCQRIAAQGYGDVGSFQEFVDHAEHQVYVLARAQQQNTTVIIGTVVKDLFKSIADAAERGDRITGISTGYERLDGKTAGLHDGDLTIVAARPGMGKTSFVLNMAVNVASPREDLVMTADGQKVRQVVPGHGVCIFSLEMPREQLGARMVCSEGGVDVGKLRNGLLNQDDWRSLADSANRLSQLPIFVDDTPAISVLELRAKVRRVMAEYNRAASPGQPEKRVGLVMVDYLQLMRGRDGLHSREQEISEISRGLKQLAKELRVPVIALSQLNRAVETRQDKRPGLSDLRESGAIEQDADNILFIYRHEYYDPKTDRKGIAEIIIAKQRNGPTGKVWLRFRSSCTRFENLAHADYEVYAQDDE